ncbi:MAG: ABC-type branched-chain amino acid transport system, ATPase component [Methanomicrobia archaeon]|nr:ABC-type branched-chain amino acid transport system, ATPase component [Methanomicrobia archaeon]
MLEVRNLDVWHGTMQILWGVDLSVGEGELVTLIGPNGAGKTTVVETLIGLNRKARGSILFQGQEILGWPSHRIFHSGLALVPERREIFPKMTVEENLQLGAHGREDDGTTLSYVHGLFPILAERKRQLAGTMSGGEQQMLAIGRALMSRPHLLILDEPSSGLSPALVTQVFTTLERLGREGMTILLLEQNVRHALELCNRGYVLENGRVITSGSSRDLLRDEHIEKAYLGI